MIRQTNFMYFKKLRHLLRLVNKIDALKCAERYLFRFEVDLLKCIKALLHIFCHTIWDKVVI